MSKEVKALVRQLVNDALEYDGLIVSINETDASEIHIVEEYSLIDETIYLRGISADEKLQKIINELHEKLNYE